jgi:hypothetical protein
MNNNKIFLIILLNFTLLLINKAVAQVMPNMKAEPKPYMMPQPFETIVKDPIKQATYITKFDLERGLKNDTTRIYYYNTKSKKISEISYEKGKALNVYYFRYKDNKLIEWSEEDTIVKRKSKYSSITQYNEQGEILCIRGFYISKKDTTDRISNCFEYDKRNNITKMTSSANDYTSSFNNYYYNNNNKLIRHDVFVNPRNTKNYLSTEYNYNNENLLEVKNEFHVFEGVKTLNLWHYYYYQDRQLVKERYLSTSSSKEETNVKYLYNKDNTLKEMLIAKDTLYKNVYYEYANKKVKKIIANSNAWNYLHGEFIILLLSVNQLTKMPYVYEEHFSYDAKWNLTEKQFLLNGQVVKVLQYKNEYY